MSIFMSYAGIKGNASDSNHRQWLDVDDLHWGVRRKITSPTSTQGDRESSNAQISDLTLTRHVDRASPYLFLEACCGKGTEVTIHLCKTGKGTGSETYIEYVLKNALISYYDAEADAQSDIRPTEQITISFVDLEVKYTPYDENGTSMSPMAVGFDTATNTRR